MAYNKNWDQWTTGTVLLVNLGVLILYTVFCAIDKSAGIIADASFVLMHFVTCVICAIALKKWSWVLAAGLVLVIGIASCANFMRL